LSGTRGASSRTLLLCAGFAAALLALLVAAAGAARAQQMMATWYGPGFEGSTTASGEPFNPDDYTAAHKTLPFGTKLIVTYNGRSVVVRVNDRGPYSGGYDLDLSQAAAEYLGLTAAGAAPVNVEFADPSTPTGPYGGEQQTASPAAQQEHPRAQGGAAVQQEQPRAQRQAALPQEGPERRSAASGQYAEAGGGAERQAAVREQYRPERAAPAQAPAPEQYEDGEEPSPGPVFGVSLKGALQEVAEDPADAKDWIELAEAASPVPDAPQPAQGGQPQRAGAAEADPASSGGSSALGISVLPDTGGASALVLAGVGALALAGLAVGRGVFRR